MKSAPCFESLTVATVSNNVCIATREGCGVRIEMSQTCVPCLGFDQHHMHPHHRRPCPKRAPMKIQTLWSHSAKSPSFLLVYLKSLAFLAPWIASGSLAVLKKKDGRHRLVAV